jgi:4-carboxymuconolactone decarboxylase
MARRALQIRREELDDEGRAVWDRIVGSRGGVRGPYQVLMQVPTLAERIAHLGSYLRFEGALPGADRELAILVVGREMGARYEWAHHEPIARREGVRPEAIEAVLALGSLEALTEREWLVVEVARGLLRHHAISDELFAAARGAFGQKGLVELVALVGYYSMIAMALVGFGVEPEGEPPF